MRSAANGGCGGDSMTPARIRALGKAAFGKGWQTQLAHALGVTPVAVSRWMNGHRKVSSHVAIAIRCVCGGCSKAEPPP